SLSVRERAIEIPPFHSNIFSIRANLHIAVSSSRPTVTDASQSAGCLGVFGGHTLVLPVQRGDWSGSTRVELNDEELQRSLRVRIPFSTLLVCTHPPRASTDRARVGVRHAAVLARLRTSALPVACRSGRRLCPFCHAAYGLRHSYVTPW